MFETIGVQSEWGDEQMPSEKRDALTSGTQPLESLAAYFDRAVLEEVLLKSHRFMQRQKMIDRVMKGRNFSHLYQVLADPPEDWQQRADAAQWHEAIETGWKYTGKYGRIWPYDGAGASIAAMLSMHYPKLGIDLLRDAAIAADTSVALIDHNTALGYRGLTFFSYNTKDDDYVDNRMISGLTAWVVIGVLREALEARSARHLRWAVDVLRGYFFLRQVYDGRAFADGYAADRRYGHIRAGFEVDLETGHHREYEHTIGEHTTDMLEVYKLAAHVLDELPREAVAAAFDGQPEALTAFRQELVRRHEAGVMALRMMRVEGSRGGEQGDSAWARLPHFVSARLPNGDYATSTVSGDYSVAVDNQTWFASQVLPYDEARVKEALRYLKARFIRDAWVLGIDGTWKRFRGTFFFAWDFSDPFVEPPPEQRPLMEEVLHPEGTLGALKLMLDILRFSRDETFRSEAAALFIELYDNLLVLHRHWGTDGLRYASRNLPGLYTTLESMAGTTWFAGVTAMILGSSCEHFLGGTPPRDFLVDGHPPAQPRPQPLAVTLTDDQRRRLATERHRLATQLGLPQPPTA